MLFHVVGRTLSRGSFITGVQITWKERLKITSFVSLMFSYNIMLLAGILGWGESGEGYCQLFMLLGFSGKFLTLCLYLKATAGKGAFETLELFLP